MERAEPEGDARAHPSIPSVPSPLPTTFRSAQMAPLLPPKPAHTPPPNWPSEIFYLTAPFYSGLPPDVVALVKSKNAPPTHKPSQNVEIRFVTDPKHPAFGQRGLFAKRLLKKGELIVW